MKRAMSSFFSNRRIIINGEFHEAIKKQNINS